MKRVPKNRTRSDAICAHQSQFCIRSRRRTFNPIAKRRWSVWWPPQNVRRHSDTIRSGDRTKHHYWKTGEEGGHRWKRGKPPPKKRRGSPLISHLYYCTTAGLLISATKAAMGRDDKGERNHKRHPTNKSFSIFPLPLKVVVGRDLTQKWKKMGNAIPLSSFLSVSPKKRRLNSGA